MKFWELTSAFKEETAILLEVLKQDKWAKYFSNYIRLEDIVRKQQRDILDEKLPFELCYEVAEKSKTEFWLSYEEQPQVLYNYKPNIENLERLLVSEVLLRFGGDKIEEAHEYSCANVEPRQLNSGAEVIASFNLTSIGLLSIIRTDENRLLDNSTLLAADGQTKWIVQNEAKMFVDPYAAYEKLQAQNRQNIRHYVLKCVNHGEKPKAGTILKAIKPAHSGKGNR